MNSNEKIAIICIIGTFILTLTIAVGLIPNSPRIIITDSNRPSFRGAEVESNHTLAFPVAIRQSLGIFIVTAYCPCPECCDEWSDGITASGYIIRPGIKFCAADPIIPFGKVLDIPGYGFVPVLDRGGLIRGKKLDVFYSTHKKALDWGVRELEIFCWVKGE